jgi:glucose/mannose transport system substrate-binding protein
LHQILEADMIGNLPMRSSCRLMRTFVAIVACVLGMAACSDEGAPDGSIKIMHWWNAGGEREAIDALLGAFEKRHPSIEIIDTSKSGGSTEQRMELATLFQEGLLPDTFQANGGWGLMAWVLYDPNDVGSTKLAEIDDLAGEWGPVPDEVLASVSYPAGLNRHRYAVPLNVHRLNTLFYNKQLFSDLDIHPERWTELSDLFVAAETIRNNSTVSKPIALGYGQDQEWSVALLFFENLLVGRRGGALYEQLFGDPENFDPFSAEFVATLEDLRTLMSFANDDAKTLPWDKAMGRVLKGEAAMTIMGDWAKGYADAQEEEEYRTAYGFVPMPGTAQTFVFTTDTFSLPIKDEKQMDTTKELLRFFGSVDGQKIFNEKKGSISARTDVPLPAGDNREATLAAFSDNTITKIGATSIRAPQTWVDAVSKALAAFATNWKDATPSEVQHTIRNHRDVLITSCCSLMMTSCCPQ